MRRLRREVTERLHPRPLKDTLCRRCYRRWLRPRPYMRVFDVVSPSRLAMHPEGCLWPCAPYLEHVCTVPMRETFETLMADDPRRDRAEAFDLARALEA